MDSLAGDFTFQGAPVMVLKAHESFSNVAAFLEEGSFAVKGLKIVFLLVGRGDAWESDRNYFRGHEDCIMEIEKQDGKILIILGASLPSVTDTRPMVSTFVFRNDRMAIHCGGGAPNLEHARPGKNLLVAGGPIEEYYDEHGNLNESGLDVIARAIQHKLESSRLVLKVKNLRA